MEDISLVFVYSNQQGPSQTSLQTETSEERLSGNQDLRFLRWGGAVVWCVCVWGGGVKLSHNNYGDCCVFFALR